MRNIRCIASSLKFFWNGVWKQFLVWNGRFLVWNGRKLPVWNIEKSSSIPYHALLVRRPDFSSLGDGCVTGISLQLLLLSETFEMIGKNIFD